MFDYNYDASVPEKSNMSWSITTSGILTYKSDYLHLPQW
jgi:hypothetical protein